MFRPVCADLQTAGRCTFSEKSRKLLLRNEQEFLCCKRTAHVRTDMRSDRQTIDEANDENRRYARYEKDGRMS